MEKTIEAHLSRVQERLKAGRETLEIVHDEGVKPYNVPDVHSSYQQASRKPPLAGDK